MHYFKATLYSPHSPLKGELVDVGFRNQQLILKEFSVEVDCALLEVTLGGFDHDELFLAWQDEHTGRWAIKLDHPEVIALAVSTAPKTFQSKLAIWHNRKYFTRWIWGSIAAFTGICLLSVVLLWWQYDSVVTWVAGHISLANEERLGNSLLAEIKSKGDIVEKGLAFKTVEDIGKRLTKGSRYHYRWLVKKDKTVNAFALPGGVVIVHTALIEKAENANELAAVLAHEVQHIEQRHSLKNMIHSLGLAAVLMVALGDVNTVTAIIIHQAGTMYFSRDIEDEADRLGYQALVRAKITPNGMVSFFQKMAKLPGADIPAWVSSHPATSDRIQTIQKLLKTQPCKDCQSLSIDWKKVREDKLIKATKS